MYTVLTLTLVQSEHTFIFHIFALSTIYIRQCDTKFVIQPEQCYTHLLANTCDTTNAAILI